MAKGKHILNKRTALVDPNTGEPMQISAKALMHGEIAVGYLAEHEALYIKNTDDEMVKFISEGTINESLSEKSDKGHTHTLSDIIDDVVDAGFFERQITRTGFIGETSDGTDFTFKLNYTTNETAHSGEFIDVDTSKVTDMEGMFSNCYGLTTLDVSNFDTSKVTNMSGMFYGCLKLTSLDVSNFDTSNVTGMIYMFYDCSNLTTLDLSNFDTSKVTDMDSMFYGCYGLTTLDVSNFDTSNVTSMNGMFSNCYGLTTLDVSNFDTSKVMDMSGMFYGCSGLTTLDVSNFDTSKVTNMGSMFNYCSILTSLDLSNFDTSKVTSMWFMFSGCSRLTSLDLSNFDTSKVTNMGRMFDDCESLRYVTLGENFFNTKTAIPFGSISNLGLNEDGTDNGWLEHLATVAPTITDGQSRTLQLHANLKNASWAATHLETLQTKGYTIA